MTDERRHATAVKAFKVTPSPDDHRAWCAEPGCSWTKSAAPRVGGSTSSAATVAAKRHTWETGHETRVDMTAQRGFRRVGG